MCLIFNERRSCQCLIWQTNILNFIPHFEYSYFPSLYFFALNLISNLVMPLFSRWLFYFCNSTYTRKKALFAGLINTSFDVIKCEEYTESCKDYF